MAQPTWLLENDMGQCRVLFAHLEQLVDLFLVLDDRVCDLRVLKDVNHLSGSRVLVHRHRDRTQ